MLAFVVAIVATFFAQEYAAQAWMSAFGPAEGAVGGAAAGATTVGAGAGVAGGGATVGAGVAAGDTIGMISTTGATTALAVGGAAGSLAGQGVMIAVGEQNGINWKSAAMAAIGSAVGYNLPGMSGNAFINGALQGAAGGVLTQGIGVAAGLQHGFDWKGIAVSAIAQGIGQGVGAKMYAAGYNRADAKLVGGFAGGVASAVARGGSLGRNIGAVTMDAVASTIGNSVVDQIAASSTQKIYGLEDGNMSAAGFIDQSGSSQRTLEVARLQGQADMESRLARGPLFVNGTGASDPIYVRASSQSDIAMQPGRAYGPGIVYNAETETIGYAVPMPSVDVRTLDNPYMAGPLDAGYVSQASQIPADNYPSVQSVPGTSAFWNKGDDIAVKDFVNGYHLGNSPRGIMEPPMTAAEYNGRLVGAVRDSFADFGYGMIGGQSADAAKANWNAGNRGTAALYEAKAFGEAGLTLLSFGTFGAVRSGTTMTAAELSATRATYGANTERMLGARTGGVEFGVDPVASGGPLRELSNGNVKITSKGVGVVENHVSRFGDDAANQLMIDRLRGISNGEMNGTVADYNFYTHELREFTRVRSLGYETGQLPSDIYYNAHSAALREYGIQPQNYNQSLRALYHPDAIRLMEGQ
jgi:hypothetical protein